MAKTYFVTGTDTGVGKTLVTLALLAAAREQHLKTLGLKPVAAGCEDTPEGLRNEDAVQIQQAATERLLYEQINPLALKAAIAPHIAAQREGKRLSANRLLGFCRGAMLTPCDLCLIEGAGGWRVPLNSTENVSDLVKALDVPVILVIGVRLGCLNHALLSAEAISRDGVKVAAWVANVVDSEALATEENIATLKHQLPFPCLGEIPYYSLASAELAQKHLDISKLL